jgi:hypothetical protein
VRALAAAVLVIAVLRVKGGALSERPREAGTRIAVARGIGRIDADVELERELERVDVEANVLTTSC